MVWTLDTRCISIRQVSLPVHFTVFAKEVGGGSSWGGHGVTPSWPMELIAGVGERDCAAQKAPEGVTNRQTDRHNYWRYSVAVHHVQRHYLEKSNTAVKWH